MRKYDGQVIHESRDEEGVLEVVEVAGVRSLHFGTYPRQSSLCLGEPQRLELPYTRAMMSCLLFHDTPRRVLLIGLGGGSLATFLLQQLPGCRVDAVEPRPAVEVVAREYFGLPSDDRLKVHIAEGLEFVRAAAVSRPGRYDLILVDAYHQDGMALSINRPVFFDACAELLTPAGILSINLWGSRPDIMEQTLAGMDNSFEGRVYRLPVKGKANVIGLGLGPQLRQPGGTEIKRRAQALEARFGLEFPLFLRGLKQNNPRRVLKFLF